MLQHVVSFVGECTHVRIEEKNKHSHWLDVQAVSEKDDRQPGHEREREEKTVSLGHHVDELMSFIPFDWSQRLQERSGTR